MKTLQRMSLRIPFLDLVFVLAAATLASTPGWAASTDEFATDLAKVAQTLKTKSAQTPPTVPEEWPNAKNLDTASRAFMDWQGSMLQQRIEMERRQTRLFYAHMKVPPPPPEPDETAKEPEPSIWNLFLPLPRPVIKADPDPSMVRLGIPLPLPTDAQLNLSVGEPTASFNVSAEAETLSFVGASYKVGVSYSARDKEWMVADAGELKTAFHAGPTQVTGSYQFEASRWTTTGKTTASPKGSVGLSVDLYQVKGAVGYNTDNELSLAVGYDLIKTPEALSAVAKASVGLEAQVSAPVVAHEMTRDKRTLSSRMRKYSGKLAKLLTQPIPCPYCSAKGRLDCPTCNNTGIITCPKCNGQLHFTCPRCKGSGLLVCSRCNGTGELTCNMCDGTGRRRCYACGGSGTVTVYDTVTKERVEPHIVTAGFDENGDPYYETRYETVHYTVQVPRQETCSVCGGTGDGGECSKCKGTGKLTCNLCWGSGTVPCKRCKGTGQVNCKSCGGTGKVKCPDCHGKPIKCPLCRGKGQLGK